MLFARSVSLLDYVVIVFFSFQVPLYLPFHIYTREAVRYRGTLSGVARWPRAGVFVIAWHIGFDSLLSLVIFGLDFFLTFTLDLMFCNYVHH